ncbi:hypothetical protein CATMIT_01771, partial [Catenibacterium mitsuokai DSM 15897]
DQLLAQRAEDAVARGQDPDLARPGGLDDPRGGGVDDGGHTAGLRVKQVSGDLARGFFWRFWQSAWGFQDWRRFAVSWPQYSRPRAGWQAASSVAPPRIQASPAPAERAPRPPPRARAVRISFVSRSDVDAIGTSGRARLGQGHAGRTAQGPPAGAAHFHRRSVARRSRRRLEAGTGSQVGNRLGQAGQRRHLAGHAGRP